GCLMMRHLAWMQGPAPAVCTMNLAALKEVKGHTHHSNSEQAAGGFASIACSILKAHRNQTYMLPPCQDFYITQEKSPCAAYVGIRSHITTQFSPNSLTLRTLRAARR